MRALAAVLVLSAVILGAVVFVLRPEDESIADILTITNDDVTHTDVLLDGCRLRVITEVQGLPQAQVALSRVVLSVDLRNFLFDTATAHMTERGVSLTFERREVTMDMVEQADRIFEIAALALDTDVSAGQSTQVFNRDARVTMQVAAMVEEAENGQTLLVPHADAPDFQDFLRGLEQDPAVTAYQTNGVYAESPPAPGSLLMGSVEIINDLTFRVRSEEEAQHLLEALVRYSRENWCHL